MPESTDGHTGVERGQIEDLGKLKDSAVGVWIQVKINNGMGVFIYFSTGGEQTSFSFFLLFFFFF